MKEIMTRKEAAEYLGVSLRYFSTFQNKIKQFRLGTDKRFVRFRKIDIDEFAASQLEDHCKFCGTVIEKGKSCNCRGE